MVIVAAITTALFKEYPTEVAVRAPEGGLKRDSVILLNQIRTIDKRRLIERWGELGGRYTLSKRLPSALGVVLGNRQMYNERP